MTGTGRGASWSLLEWRHKALTQIMLNEKSPPNARVGAANTLLDRAYGKPAQFNTSDAQSFKKAIDMTDDELAAIASRARLTLVKSNT